MKRVFPIFLLVLGLLLAKAEVKAAPRQDSPRTPAEIIRLINYYRAENGLPAYVQNSTLMGTAQDASDYQAAIEQVTHEGPGGSRPRDRAYAAGYGDGKIIWISEIIYGYTFGTPDDAVNWWKTSEIHNYTMLAPQYKEIGAGVALANNRYYFTAVVGWISIYDNTEATPTAGPSPTASHTPSSTSTTASNPTSTPTETTTSSPTNTVIASSPTASQTAGPSPTPSNTPTPLPEGTITHIVKAGDTLSLIAARYGLTLEEILAFNNLTLTSLIFPGDIILIQAAPTATETVIASATNSPTPSATPSLTPTATDTETATATASATPTSTTEVLAQLQSASNPPLDPLNSLLALLENTDYLAVAIIGFFGLALVPIGVLAYFFENRRS